MTGKLATNPVPLKARSTLHHPQHDRALREALPTADVQDAILERLDVAYKNIMTSEKRKLDAARDALDRVETARSRRREKPSPLLMFKTQFWSFWMWRTRT